MASEMDLSALSQAERVVWGQVSKRLTTVGVGLRILELNLKELEESTTSYKKQTDAYVAEFEALSAKVAEKQTAFDALAAELMADEETRAAAEYCIADLAKSSAALKKGSQTHARAVGGRTDPTLTYRLRELPLIDSGNQTPTYFPEVVSKGHVGDGEFRRILAMGTTLQSADVSAMLSNIREHLAYLLCHGHSVSLGDMFIIKPGLRGTCIGKKAEAYGRREFLPVVNVRVMPKFAKEIRTKTSIGLCRTARGREPMISKLIDLSTGAQGLVIRPGSALCVQGRGLDYNLKAEDEGFYFSTSENLQPCAYRLSVRVMKNMIKPKQAVFSIPADLPSGVVGRLSLRRRLRNSDRLLTYVFPDDVTTV